jgi:hypothetical protein
MFIQAPQVDLDTYRHGQLMGDFGDATVNMKLFDGKLYCVTHRGVIKVLDVARNELIDEFKTLSSHDKVYALSIDVNATHGYIGLSDGSALQVCAPGALIEHFMSCIVLIINFPVH